MGGAIELLVSTAADPLQEATDQAKALVDANLNLSLPQSDWDSCQDPDALEWISSDPALNIAGGSNCISFGADSFWHRFLQDPSEESPSQQVATSFGSGIGCRLPDHLSLRRGDAQRGRSKRRLPIRRLCGHAGGAEVCIKTGTGANNKTSCGDPSTGDFGNFQPYFYYEINPASNPKSECTSGNQSDPLSRAMADGLDHRLGIITGSAPRINGDNCPQVPGPALPNRVDSKAGYSNTDITNGLIKGNNWDGPFDGRLTRSNTSGYGTATVFNEDLDNRPLWTYILDDTDPILVQAGRVLDAKLQGRSGLEQLGWPIRHDHGQPEDLHRN